MIRDLFILMVCVFGFGGAIVITLELCVAFALAVVIALTSIYDILCIKIARKYDQSNSSKSEFTKGKTV